MSSYSSLQLRAERRAAGVLGGNFTSSKLISNTDSLGPGGGTPGTAQDWYATNVAGIRTWNSLGRFVKRGEKGIPILAPIVGHRRSRQNESVLKSLSGLRIGHICPSSLRVYSP